MKNYPKLGGDINEIWSSNIRIKLAAGSLYLGQKQQPACGSFDRYDLNLFSRYLHFH